MKRLKPLIGICGAAGSGKDTLADGIAKIDVYMIHHLADPIKDALNAMFGWTRAQWEDREWKEAPLPWLSIVDYRTVSPRTLAQTLGTEWGRDIVHPEIWLRIAQAKYEKIAHSAEMRFGRVVGMGMIVPDIRFENEAKWIRDAGGMLFKVNRPGVEPVAQHASETADLSPWINYTIQNDGPPSKMVSNARELLWQDS